MCMYINVYVRMYVCVHIYIYIYIYIYHLKLQNLRASISITLIKNCNAHDFLQMLKESK